jgi:hypothetical protein
MRWNLLFMLLLVTGVVLAEDAPEVEPVATASEGQEQTKKDANVASTSGERALGMSILGNQEAPKSLVIVPWKSSEVGNSLGISAMLDDSRRPIDKEVFMRALSYYEIRSNMTP